jgi:hypothetical protein
VIKMFFEEHSPPHFHANYGDEEALIEIRNLSLFAGRLSPRVVGLVVEWATLHQQELMANWIRAQSQEALRKIEPLH